MNTNVVLPYRLAEKRRQRNAKDIFDRETVQLEEQLREKKCCEMVETGSNPYDDVHLCLRKKGHKGYHMDKETGFQWKWEEP